MSAKIRYRKLNDKTSLYLDVYYKGKRYQKPLEHILLHETDVISTSKNVETMKIVTEMEKTVNDTIKNGTFDFETFKYGKDTALGKILDDFLDTKTPRTQVMYKSSLITITKYAGNSLTVRSFEDKKFLIGLIQHFRETLSENTIILRITCLKNLIRYLIEMELITRNVWSEIPKHLTRNKAKDVDISYLSISEIKELAISSLPDKYKMPFLLSCYSGLRKSDIFALKFSDIRDNVIYLKQQKTQSYNQIPLSKPAIEILNHQRELRPDTDVVFQTVSTFALASALKNTCKKLFNKHIHFHVGRHTFAINSLSLGMNIVTLQSFLGHAKIEMTLRYAKVLPADKQKAIAIYDNI